MFTCWLIGVYGFCLLTCFASALITFCLLWLMNLICWFDYCCLMFGLGLVYIAFVGYLCRLCVFALIVVGCMF